MKKRIFAILLAVLLLGSALTPAVFAVRSISTGAAFVPLAEITTTRSLGVGP